MKDMKTGPAQEPEAVVIDPEFEDLPNDVADEDFAGVILAYGFNNCVHDCW